MIITISGPPGSGKSTLSKLLAEKLGLKIISPGSIFREKARQMGLSLEALGELAEKNPDIDREIDEAQQKIAAEQDNLILEGRLSGHLVDADLKIWLTAPEEVRANRIAQRENLARKHALEENRKREACENKRYQQYYNLNPKDTTIYHLTLDTSKFTPETLAEIIQTALKQI